MSHPESKLLTEEIIENTDDKTNKMAQKYEKLAVGLELKFIEFLDSLNLPERPNLCSSKAKSNFNWIKV